MLLTVKIYQLYIHTYNFFLLVCESCNLNK